MKKNQEKQKNKIIIGLKKARTSLERIIEMLDNQHTLEGGSDKKSDRCFGIIQQNLSVIGLLKSVNIALLESHLDLYVKKVQKGGANKRSLEKMKEEVLKILKNAQDK